MKGRRLVAGVAVVVAAAGILLQAAPIAPTQTELPEEVFTLRGLKQVRFKIAPIPANLDAAGVTEQMLGKFVQLLSDRGFEIVEDEQAPLLQLVTNGKSSAEHPSVIAVILAVGVHQRVTLHRLELEITTPTTTVSHAVVTTKGQVAEVLPAEIETFVRQFTNIVELANAGK